MKHQKNPDLLPGMRTKGITAGYAHPWPKGLPTPACAQPGYDPDWWHPTTEDTRGVAERICRTECALTEFCATAARTRGEYGVWGGVLFNNGAPVTGVLGTGGAAA